MQTSEELLREYKIMKILKEIGIVLLFLIALITGGLVLFFVMLWLMLYGVAPF